MGDPGGELSHRFHFLGMAQLRLQLQLFGDFLFQLGIGRLQGGRPFSDAQFELVIGRLQFGLGLVQQRVFARDQDAPDQSGQEHHEDPDQRPQQSCQRPPGRSLQQSHVVPGTEAEQE